MTAFLFLFDVELGARVERIIVIVFVSLFVSWIALALGFGVSQSKAFDDVNFRDLSPFALRAAVDLFNVSETAVRVLSAFIECWCLFCTTFVTVSSAIGYFLLRKRGMSKDNLNGVLRWFVLSCFMSVGMILRATNFFFEMPTNAFGAPRWFTWGLCYLGANSLLTVTFFLFCVLALLGGARNASSKYRHSMTTEMSQELMSYESEIGDRPVPAQYVI